MQLKQLEILCNFVTVILGPARAEDPGSLAFNCELTGSSIASQSRMTGIGRERANMFFMLHLRKECPKIKKIFDQVKDENCLNLGITNPVNRSNPIVSDADAS